MATSEKSMIEGRSTRTHGQDMKPVSFRATKRRVKDDMKLNVV
jgi:hypothetical protein